ncbi:MAG: 50S ribosomal protein L25 [Myxococcota bacterium]|nr:50S ribosomal protein L25 [Myxococcota bacterium]
MDATPLQAQSRTDFGKGAARKLRAAGQIPALVYRDGAEPTHVAVDPQALSLIYQRSNNPNTILGLTVGEQVINCLLVDTQKHPVSRKLLHADFYAIREDESVLVEVPVVPVGKAKGATFGGKIQRLRHTVPVRALPKDIPAVIEVDVSPLDLGDILRSTEVSTPEGCTIVSDTPFNVFACKGRRVAASS